MNVLFIGGTGVISSACTSLAIERGMQVTVLNRGQTHRSLPKTVQTITADVHNRADVQRKIDDLNFDVVVDWIAYNRHDVERDYELFKQHCKQFVFISSASAYQKPARLPVSENWPLENPFWQYSSKKIECEAYLFEKFHQNDFPVTIVRPSHTFDKTMIPLRGGWTSLQRMHAEKPVFIHGDGTSVWTLTHAQDFAKGFVGLLGNQNAIGEAFHITSDEWLTWNEIYQTFADILDVKLNAVHVLSNQLAEMDANLGAGLLGDKAHSMIFDNRKIKRYVPEYKATIPFYKGAQEIVAYYLENQRRIKFDKNIVELYKKLKIE